MEYTVVPFTANISSSGGASDASSQLESLIYSYASDGWEYVRLEQVETHIAGTSGCFGTGGTPSRTISVSMVVFRK